MLSFVEIILVVAFGVFVVALIGRVVERRRKRREMIMSVTDLSRGEWSERDLIPTLIEKCGIDSRQIYHDLYLQKPNGNYTQIDMVLTLPQGLVVFEIKDYSGWIFGSQKSKYWTQILAYGREHHKFYNPIMQNNAHIVALRRSFRENPNVRIFNIVVFYGNCEFKELHYDDTWSLTRVVYDTQVVQVMQNIKALDPTIYGNKREVMDVLAAAVRNGRNPVIRRSQREYASRSRNA